METESNHDQKILPVFVTLDPLRDTPFHLHAYLKGPPLYSSYL